MKETFKEIINDALWAPTPSNLQNWNIQINEENFVIKVNKEVAENSLDPFFSRMMISLGGLCEYLKISSAKRGYQLHWKLSEDCLELNCHLEKENTKILDSSLYEYLKKRRTSRSKYKKDLPSFELVVDLMETNNLFSSQIKMNYRPTSEFFDYLYNTESLYIKELSSLLKTLEQVSLIGEVKESGITRSASGLSKYEIFFILKLSKFKKIVLYLINSGLNKFIAKLSLLKYQDSSGFILFICEKLNPESYFETGRHSTQVWLTLTKHGYTAQPLSFSSITCFDTLLNRESSIAKSNSRLFNLGNKVLKETFDLKEQFEPSWMFRFGKSEFDDLCLQSKRKGINNFLDC